MNQPAGYEVFDHTADVGVRAWGPEPGVAFAQAGLGMFAVILGGDPAIWQGAGEEATIAASVEGDGWDELLVNWLAELLFRFEVEALVPRSITVERCAPPSCTAQLAGLRLADPAEAAGVAVKAVTYHQLSVAIAPERTDVNVILDI